MAARPHRKSHSAEKPRIPAATPSLQQAEQEREEYIRTREQVEHRSVLRGLLLLALVVLVFSMWRAGTDRVFVGRWWWP